MAIHKQYLPENIRPARLLGLDYGRKRVGVAVCTVALGVVTPLKNLSYTKWAGLKADLAKIVIDYRPDAVVIGYPLNSDGSQGERCQATRDFARLLEDSGLLPADTPIVLFDERRSSLAADERGATKESRDAIAAQIILEDFLSTIPA